MALRSDKGAITSMRLGLQPADGIVLRFSAEKIQGEKHR
jgi:hypothetical protein